MVVVIVITDVTVSGTGTVVGGGEGGVMITFLVLEYVSVLVRVTGIVTGVELIVVVLYVTGWVFVVITIIEVVYGRVTDTVLGSGVGSVFTISFVVVYSVVFVSVTGTVITLDFVVMVLYVTGNFVLVITMVSVIVVGMDTVDGDGVGNVLTISLVVV